MLNKVCCALLGVIALAGTITSASAGAHAISTDSRRPWMTVPADPGSKISAMFLYSNTPNADIVSLATAGGTLLPPLFCTKDISGTCSASKPGDTALIGIAGPHGELPIGVPAPFVFDLDTGTEIPVTGPINLALTNTGDCGVSITGCTFIAGQGVPAPGDFESGSVYMDWVLPCPGIFFNPAKSVSVGNDGTNASICGTKSGDPWATYGFAGAPSLAALLGTTKADFLSSKLAAGQLNFIAFQDTVFDTSTDFNAYTYDDAVLAVWSDPVPEPISIALFGAGVVGLAGIRWRKRAPKPLSPESIVT
jgi:hypothetical protein